MFTGRVRERLQQVFGTGGEAYIVAGQAASRRALGAVRKRRPRRLELRGAAKVGRSTRRFYLSGFNAVAHHAGAELDAALARRTRYDRAEVAFLKVPGGGRAEVGVDGSPSGEINLDGAADERATLAFTANDAERPGLPPNLGQDGERRARRGHRGRRRPRRRWRLLSSASDSPARPCGCCRSSTTENIADDFRRMEPDIVVLAFGTNEGFNDNLDVGAYTAHYEQIVRRLMDIRPGLRDRHRRAARCGAAGRRLPRRGRRAGVRRCAACRSPPTPAAANAAIRRRRSSTLVREAQRKLAPKLGRRRSGTGRQRCRAPAARRSGPPPIPPLMAHDFVHMTLEGYKQSADQFADFLIPLIEGRQATTHVVSNN